MNARERSRVLWVIVGASSVFVSVASTDAQVVFRDQNLKAAVKQTLGITHDPNEADMLALTWLDARQKGITDLTGLEHAANLRQLILPSNDVSDISPLAGLTSLAQLDLHHSHVTDISPLANLTSLDYLEMHGNRVSDIPLP